MQLPTYFLYALLLTSLGVFGVGIAVVSVLDRVAPAASRSRRPELVFVIAAGLYWNALAFIALFFAKVDITPRIVGWKLTLEALIVASALVFGRASFRAVLRSILRDGVSLAFAGIGALLGVWAMMQFPHVLDSGQILWTQKILDDGMGALPASAMMGYSGLVSNLAALFPASPVVLVAATFKPLLFLLHGAVAAAIGSSFAPRHRAVTALCFVLLSLCSSFGTYGLVELGKDSIWGIVLAVAFVATLCRTDAAKRGLELGIYFATASTLGVIAMPYMLAAYVLWLVVSEPERRNADTILPMLLVGLPVLPSVVAGFLGRGLLPVYGGYAGFVVLVFLFMRVKPAARVLAILSRPVARLRAFVPLACAVPCLFLFPAALSFPVWGNADGTVLTETRPPLDGVTTFWTYVASNGLQNATVLSALAASLVAGLTPAGRRNPGLVACAAMPFLVLLLCLLRVHLGLPVISDFNVWDLTKDIPLWLGGSVLVFTLLAVIADFARITARRRVYPIALAVVTGGCLYSGQRALSPGYFMRPVHAETHASFASQDMATVANIAWEGFRDRTFWMDTELSVTKNYFYSLQMYDVVPAMYDGSDVETALKGGPEMGFVLSNRKLEPLRRAVAARQGSLRYIAGIQNGEASVVGVSLDGANRIELPSGLASVAVLNGQYEEEKAGNQAFRWMRQDSTFAVTAAAPSVCVEFSLFSPDTTRAPQVVTLKGGEGRDVSVNVAQSPVNVPSRLSTTVAVVDGTAQVSLSAAGGEAEFPNDARRIAFGLLMPVKITDGGCAGK